MFIIILFGPLIQFLYDSATAADTKKKNKKRRGIWTLRNNFISRWRSLLKSLPPIYHCSCDWEETDRWHWRRQISHHKTIDLIVLLYHCSVAGVTMIFANQSINTGWCGRNISQDPKNMQLNPFQLSHSYTCCYRPTRGGFFSCQPCLGCVKGVERVWYNGKRNHFG